MYFYCYISGLMIQSTSYKHTLNKVAKYEGLHMLKMFY